MIRMNTLKILFVTLLFMCIQPGLRAQSCWSEVWVDNFDGTTLNTANWSYDIGNGCPNCGWGNSEQEYYTNTTQNVSVSGGLLNITARYSANYAGSGNNITSGKIHTRNKQHWTNGRFEARMKLPAGTGTWPAFWMLPEDKTISWPTSGEIDIMEYRGDQITKIDGTLHYGSLWPANQHDGNSYTLSSGDFTNTFHLFAVEWDANAIRWYVDGILFKTETKSPNSLNPPSTAAAWPWDNDFYIILNLAVGGWYSGNPSENSITGGNTSWTANMQVDYVKVYTDLSGGALTGAIAGKTSVLPNETSIVYSIPATSGATYAWTVTPASTITGQGTNSITINWGNSSGTVSVTKTLTCGSSSYSLPVTVMPVNCGSMLEDFENIRVPKYGTITGQFNQKVITPNASAENTSPFCAQYVRNASEQYDILVIENPAIGDADLIKNNTNRLLFDVYSDAAGRVITLSLEDNALSGGTYPAGRHSRYTATTTKINQWETLTFKLLDIPSASVIGTNVNRLVFLFSSNTKTNPTFYIDNLIFDTSPATAAITGIAAVVNNQSNVLYSVTNTAGYTYNWTVPSDAIINSGQGTNSINVTFGTLGGAIAVASVRAGCTGAVASKTITNSNPTSTTDVTSTSYLSIAPNPVGENMILKLNSAFQEGAVEIQLMESNGKIISESTYNNIDGNELSIPVVDLNPGYYLIRITKGDYSVVKGMFKN